MLFVWGCVGVEYFHYYSLYKYIHSHFFFFFFFLFHLFYCYNCSLMLESILDKNRESNTSVSLGLNQGRFRSDEDSAAVLDEVRPQAEQCVELERERERERKRERKWWWWWWWCVCVCVCGGGAKRKRGVERAT
jgi:hypothetical protein